MHSISAADRKALKRFRLAQRLRDSRKLIASLRWYDAHLVPGQWIELRAPRREKSRPLNPGWSEAMTAARRILGIVARCVRDEHGNILRDRKGRKRLKYYLRRGAWEIVSTRLSFRYDLLWTNGPSQTLYLSEAAESRIKRHWWDKQFEFDDALLNPEIATKFESLPAGFRMSKELEELSTELGPLFLERAKAWLVRDIDEETQARFVQSQNEHANGAERVKIAPQAQKCAVGPNGTQADAFNQPDEPRQRKRKPLTVESEMARQIRLFLIRQSIGN